MLYLIRVFKTKFFDKFARKSRITNTDLCEAIKRARRELIDADLGSGVIKQRVARKGQGKSGGFRTIVLLRAGDRAIFVDGYAKKNQSNFSQDDFRYYKELARVLLAYSEIQLNKAVSSHVLMEVLCDEEKLS